LSGLNETESGEEDSPTLSVMAVGAMLIVAAVTVTIHETTAPPASAFAEIVVVPLVLAVTSPSDDTVAIEVLLLDHVTFLLMVSAGLNVTESFPVEPVANVNVGTFIVNSVPVTVTVQTEVAPPSVAFTVIWAVPTAFAVTTPLEETVAIDVLLLDQLTFLLLALLGLNDTESWEVSPDFNVSVVGETVTVHGVTVIAHVVVAPPASAFAVIVAVPLAFAVTSPSDDTVAIEVLLLDHVTFLLIVSAGLNVTESCPVAPVAKVIVGTFIVIDVPVTVTAQTEVAPPSEAFTVIWAVPTALAVTTPLEETVAIDVLLLDQVTFLLLALLGLNDTESWEVSPDFNVSVVGETLTVHGVTVIAHVVVAPPASAFAVIVAVPLAFAVTSPSDDTVAIEVLLLDHVTFLLIVSAGLNATESCPVEPVANVIVGTFIVIAVPATVTVQTEVAPPSEAFTIIWAVPTALAVTTPLEETVAIDVLLLDQVTFLLLALLGLNETESWEVSPDFNISVVGEIVTEHGVTVIVHVVVAPPASAFAVIVAVPLAFAVTSPSDDTLAIEVLLLDHVTFLFIVSVGLKATESCPVEPVANVIVGTFIVIDVPVTVTAQTEVAPPSEAFTVIWAVPTAFAVTRPLEETVATDVLLLDQVTFLLLALLGLNETESWEVSPDFNVSVVGETVTAEAVTVTAHVALAPPADAVAVIVACPEFFAVTKPSDDTLAMFVLLLDHDIFWFGMSEGFKVAVN